MPQFFDCEQGSEEWARLRCGIATSSDFNIVLRDGATSKTYHEYKLKKVGEILTGQPADNYTNWHHERGKQYEPLARDEFAFYHPEVELNRIGFIKNAISGCSPDSLIGKDGGLEIKTMLPHLLLDIMLKEKFPPQFKAQCQGNIWISEREWWDLAIFWPGLPIYVKRMYRDDGYIANLAGAVAQFNAEVAEIVEQVRSGHRPSLTEQLQQSLVALGAAE